MSRLPRPPPSPFLGIVLESSPIPDARPPSHDPGQLLADRACCGTHVTDMEKIDLMDGLSKKKTGKPGS